MTFRQLVLAIARRWYVMAVVIVCAAALGLAFQRDGGGFYTRTVVTFTWPASSTLLPDNGTTDSSVIAFAGAVAAEINLGKPVLRYAAADAPYYGAGIREGVLVALPNTGGQWANSYSSATIEIQIVGRTREWVVDRQEALLAAIRETTQVQQAAVVERQSSAIVPTVEPVTTMVSEYVPTRTGKMAAMAALGAAAVLVGGWVSVAFDRRPGRKRVS